MKNLDRRIMGFVLFAFVLGYIFFCVVSIVIEYPNTLNIFYQPCGKSILPIAIAYPPISSGQLQDEWLQVMFDLEADGTLSEGVNLTITNVLGTVFIDYSLINQTSGLNVNDVWIGFQYAQPWSSFTFATWGGQTQNRFFTALDGNWLIANHSETYWQSTDGNPYALGYCPLKTVMQMVFYFPSSGDYSPSIIVGLNNGTFLECTYEQIKVHVLSNAELQALKFSRIDNAVTISLLLFAGIEGFSLMNNLIKKRPERKRENKRKDEQSRTDWLIGNDYY